MPCILIATNNIPTGFSDDSKTEDLLNSDCSSCRVTQDKSAYWTPPMYFQDEATGKFELVNQVGGMLAYYLLYGNNITAFPTNFRMISGDTNRRSYTLGDVSAEDPPKSLWASMGQTSQSDLAQRAIGFNCLNYQKAPEGTLYRHHMPSKEYLDANCANGLRLELMFPSCWDGKNLDSENHRDHVAFPNLVMNGDCPPEFPVRLPSMLFEVIHDTTAFKGRNGRFVMANGDPTGFGFHGDFWMGWDEKFLQEAVETCTNPSGRIEDCPLFNVVSEGEAASCKIQRKKSIPELLFGDNVKGPSNILPGNVKITVKDGEDSSPVPSLTYKAGDLPTNKASPLPGNVFKEKGKQSSSAAPPPPPPKPTTTAPPAAVTPPPEAAKAYSTEYITDGSVVSEIIWQEELVTVTQVVDAVATAPAAKRSHLHGHARRHF